MDSQGSYLIETNRFDLFEILVFFSSNIYKEKRNHFGRIELGPEEKTGQISRNNKELNKVFD